MALELLDVDIFSPDSYVPGVPHHMFARLRREAPVYFHREPDGLGFWALTKYEDVLTVSRDSGLFSSARGTNIEDVQTAEELAQIQLLMLNTDPPRHTKLRNLVNKGFTPRQVARLEPRIREITNRIIDNVAPKGTGDFVTEIAAELPLQVIVEMLGVPAEDRHKVFEWSNKMIGFDDPEYQNSRQDAMRTAEEMWAYAFQLGAERRAEPRDDIISILMQGEVDGEQLSDMEFAMFFLLLSVAGNETTRNTISGGMLALIEHPDQRQRLIDDPSLVPIGVEEMLRWVTPVMYFRRTVTRDIEIRGHRIKAGDKVCMYYISANRDEDVFPNADTFDVGRLPNEHLAFGGGGHHHCLGANLARLELGVMFEELLRRLPDVELNGPVRRLRSNFIGGIKEMPVRFSHARL